MKRVIVICRTEDSPNITSLLKDLTYMRSEYAKLTRFSILVADETLDDLISKIQQALKFMDKSTIVEVFSPDFVISPALSETIQEEGKKRKTERSPVEKLIESAQDSADISRDTLALAAIASLVALIGLFLNNVGIVIGAMLLAPLLGPIYSFAITTTTGNRRLVVTCLRTILIFLVAIVLIAFLTTFILSLVFDLPLTSEILSRTVPAPIYIIMAILLGFAVILALSTGIPESVAGVAVAAALLPPAAVVGISLAIHTPGAFGALILTLENVAGLMAGSVVGAMALQVTPRSYREKMNARTMLYRILWMLIVLIILLVFLSILPL
jgi:uncharacterized hydrophobic protein (TIGR00341 family)